MSGGPSNFSPPDVPTGELSEEQRERFGRWINSKAPLVGKCPVCGTRNWTLLGHFVEIPIYRGGNIVFGSGPSYPNVGLLCTNCGNTQLINAVVSGVIDDNSTGGSSSGGGA